MIIKMNLDGVIEKTYGSRVFKGSNAVTEIALFAPFDPQSTVIINFTLPDGTEIPGIMTFADFNVEDHYNMWVYKLRQNVTSMEGRVTLSFEIRAYVDETEVTTTAETHVYIEKSSSTTFLDEVDEFLALANEALARSQQALNLNQATNEAMEIEIERNNEQDNAIATINQTLISQQNAINEHDNKLENLRQETNEAIQSEVERNNAQDQSINVLGERMSIAEQNIGVLNNQVNALPEPQDILTKQNYTMPEGYAPTQPKHIADKEYVDDAIEAMSGTNPGHFVTHAQLDEALYKPDFFDLTITEPVYHIEEATLDSPKEIQVIEGNTVEIDGQLVPVKNPVIESVGKNLFDGAWEVGGYSLDDGTPINESDRIRSLNFTKVKPQQTYSINLEFSNANRAFYFDVNKQFIGYTNNARVFTTPNNCHYVKFVDHITDINKQHMLNLGSTPLPYEPYRSTELQFNGIYHKWDKIINDGGVYWDEVGSGKITFDGSEEWGERVKGDEVTRFKLSKNHSIYNNYTNNYMLSNDLYIKRSYVDISLNEFQMAFHENGNIYIGIPNNELGTQTINDYLSQNPLTVVYQLATPTRKPTSILKAGDPDFSQGNTIYLHSDTEAIPTVHAKVAMDIAGQVNQLTKDSYEKGKKIHELEVKITDDITNLKQDVDQNTSDIAEIQDKVTDVENDINYIGDNINTLNTEVSGINQTITDLEDAVSQNSSIITNLQNELATLQNSLPKGVNDATLTIDGKSDGGSVGMTVNVDQTFTLAVTGLDFYKVNWSVSGDNLSIVSTDGDNVTLSVTSTGPGRSLTATITDIYGRTKSITVSITVFG